MKSIKSTTLIYFFGALKLVFHLLTSTNYGLHRDEYLYFDQGKHLSWGFYEVPPITPLIGRLAGILGGHPFVIRLFPALAGVIIIILACKLVKELGGNNWAILFTGTALVFSPALLTTNSLFQPVSFNQLWWFLSAYVLIKIIRNNSLKYWCILGILAGVGFLTKYSILFYFASLFVAILITKKRSILWSKHFLYAVSIAFIIVLPNILWQFNHGLPVIQHMQELKETQLVHMNWSVFLSAHLEFHLSFSIIWLLGLIGLFKNKELKKYQFAGFAFIFTILIIGLLHGKAYYTLGAFLILFPFGGIMLEKIVTKTIARSVLLLSMLLIVLMALPFSPFPILKLESLNKYIKFADKKLGISHQHRWEDGKYYNIPQDIADMHAWEELAQRVAAIYHALPKEQKEKCMIYGGSYGHAAALNYFKNKYNLPTIYSFNGSYLYWADTDIDFDRQILIDDRRHDHSDWFSEMTLVDSIQNPVAREKGYIYYRSQPKINVAKAWKEALLEERTY